MAFLRKLSPFASLLLMMLGGACSSSTTDPVPAADASAATQGDAASTPVDAGTDAPVVACTAATAKPCDDCLQAGECHVTDNDCNDDPTCNAAENAWFICLCQARAGNGTTASCDSTFTTNGGGAKASVVVQCMRSKCAAVCF
jgi:hypothetical protein